MRHHTCRQSKGFPATLLLLTGLILVAMLLAACTSAAPATPTAAKSNAQPTVAKSNAQPTVAPVKPTAAPTKPAAEKPIEPPVTVNLGTLGSISDSGLFIALEKGYFKEQGISIEMTRFDSGARMVAPLSASQLDVGAGSASAGLYNAVSRGIPLRIVADKGKMSPGFGFEALVVRKDLIDSGKVKSYADLKGMTIATAALGVGDEVVLYKALELGKLSDKDVRIVEVPFPDMNAALANKSLDAALQIEPNVAQGVEKGIFVRWKGEEEIYPDQQKAVILYSPKFVESKPEVAKRFMVAYVKGLRDFNDAFIKGKGKDEAIKIIMKNTGLKDPKLFDTMKLAGLDPNGRINVKSLEDDQDWYLAKGSLKEKVDLKNVIDYQYVDYALEKLGKY
ncbi:MAG: ABC transporter substrate-binding protein [Chloroflexi bacterium]|nr:ABC transporter substrate-binding protein [Chloroflexota bacterium]